MIEGEGRRLFPVPPVPALLQQFLDRCPARAVRVATRAGSGEVGGEGEMRDTDHTHPGVTLGVAVGRELLEVCAVVLCGHGGVVGAQARLLGQLACRGLGQVLVGAYEAAGQCPSPLERLLAPPYRQRAQGMAAHGQYDQVHGHGEGRKG